jgi:transposase
MMRKKPNIIELNMDDLDDILQRVDEKRLEVDDYQTIRTVIESYVQLHGMVGDKSTTIARLRKMLFGASTEKTSAVIGDKTDRPAASSEIIPAAESEPDAKPPVKNHGRNGADAYTGAEQIFVPHESLQPGDPCPECHQGTLYESRPGVLVRIVGQAPFQAKVYRMQKLRCQLCGKIFKAKLPEGVPPEKYDATVGSVISLLKYGTGMPFNRDERLQGSMGIPLPASTQWDIVHSQAQRAEPIYTELIRQAAQGEVIYNDDTTAKILAMMGDRAKQAAMEAENEPDAAKKTAQRTGIFTSGIVSTRDGRRIALFFSGRQHAGENLKDVLAERAADLPPPIQMCDALSRNVPAELETILANCLAHGRRLFVDLIDRFPAACRYVLESLKIVYRNDAIARERDLSKEDRLQFHQAESGPAMRELHAWLARQFDERRVEPNSRLGEAISYLLKHWEKLTLFLRVPGAPLDNNVCERALKKAILHRKNSYFFKTQRGAHVGDIFMSLIYTCELSAANPFDYLTELERHSAEAASNPQGWMPWNYRELLKE